MPSFRLKRAIILGFVTSAWWLVAPVITIVIVSQTRGGLVGHRTGRTMSGLSDLLSRGRGRTGRTDTYKVSVGPTCPGGRRYDVVPAGEPRGRTFVRGEEV
jgi:hypothetical protein